MKCREFRKVDFFICFSYVTCQMAGPSLQKLEFTNQELWIMKPEINGNLQFLHCNKTFAFPFLFGLLWVSTLEIGPIFSRRIGPISKPCETWSTGSQHASKVKLTSHWACSTWPADTGHCFGWEAPDKVPCLFSTQSKTAKRFFGQFLKKLGETCTCYFRTTLRSTLANFLWYW